MALRNLSEFIAALDAAGELVRIRQEVSTHLEITEISDRVMKSDGGGKALLFERPRLADGSVSAFPVAMNLFGSWKRMAMALECERLEEHAERITELLQPKIPEGLWGKLQMLPKLAELRNIPPRDFGSKPPCREVVLEGDAVDLTRLPVLHCWPKDSGPFITLPMVITADPDTGVQNMGMYRMEVKDGQRTMMHWQRHKGGAAHFRAWKAKGGRMPVVVTLGGDPTTMYAPTAPLPPGIDEYLFGGFLRREPVTTTKALTCDLRIPAEAEFVLEGYVDTDEAFDIEGPFGDHTGFYTAADLYPSFHVTHVTHRKNAVYPATIVGIPPVEDVYLGGATEKIFLPLMKMTLPEIVDVHMPPEGVFHNLVFVSIKKQYPGHAWKVIHGLWGLGLMSLAKVVVVVDDLVDVQNTSEAWWYTLGNIDPERDVHFAMGPVDDLDHSSRRPAFGSKMGIDATAKWKEEGFDRPWPEITRMDDETRRRIDALWPGLGLSK